MAILDANLPPTESAVVGQHRDDPDQLLLLGEDGGYYAYSIPDDSTSAVEPDEQRVFEETDDHSLFA